MAALKNCFFALFTLTLLLITTHLRADDNILEVGVDTNLIAIDLQFSGSDLVLFGSASENTIPVIVIRGPIGDVSVWRKKRTAGLWVNHDNQTFTDVPLFYRISYPGEKTPFILKSILRRHQIGLDHLMVTQENGQTVSLGDGLFSQGLRRQMTAQALYNETASAMRSLGSNLFRADFHIPANAVPGIYLIEAFLVRDGLIVSAQSTPLFVKKTGFGWQVYYYAHSNPILYGIFAVLLAMIFGVLIGKVFKR